MTIETFPVPAPRAGEVLVKIDCATLCRSDLHTILGKRVEPTPSILGHEMLGRVVAINESERACDAHGHPIGLSDRISWSIMANCGDCYFCRSAMEQKCERLFKYGHEAITPGMAPTGGLSEVCLVRRGTTIVRVPEALSDREVCPANCATATAAAALRTAGDVRGQCVVVHGAGMLGLTAIAMAVSRGARTVLATDIVASRLDTARRFGASNSFHLSQGFSHLIREVLGTTANRGADCVLDFSGANEPLEASIDLLRIGGRLILVGSVFPAPKASWAAEQIVRKLIRIEGVHNYRPVDLVTAVDFLSKNATHYPFASLVEAEYPLSKINSAVSVAKGSAMRVAVTTK